MTSATPTPPLATVSCRYKFNAQYSSHFLTTTAKPLPFRLHFSLNNNHHHHHIFHFPTPTFTKHLILLIFSFTLLSLRLCSRLLLPDFSHRWKHLIAFSSQAEAQLIRSHNPCPKYLLQAVVAYEDRRFFNHFGADPIGVARAVLSFSALGGGSTITQQQLVKNTFLKNERTFLRKFTELVLAVALERRISKLGILSAYLCKIYWGHGIYGIESASNFYFGKHPSLLSLGECALLVGMIPAPELRSPFRDSRRGKTFQARVLKRMVDVDFIDIETALLVVNQLVNISVEPDYAEESSFSLSSFTKQSGTTNLESGSSPTIKEIWDWERESKIWEVREDMERWAMNLCKTKKSVKISYSNYKGTSFQSN